MPLLPLRICFSNRSFSGSPATSAPLTSRCSPLATSVTTIAARRLARSVLRAERMESFNRPSPHRPGWCRRRTVRPSRRSRRRRRIPASSACRCRSRRCASVTTAPSTQPPETEPRKLPSSSITRLEPTGRGAEPQVSTTVASATPRPALRQSSAALQNVLVRRQRILSHLNPLRPVVESFVSMSLSENRFPLFGLMLYATLFNQYFASALPSPSADSARHRSFIALRL